MLVGDVFLFLYYWYKANRLAKESAVSLWEACYKLRFGFALELIIANLQPIPGVEKSLTFGTRLSLWVR